MPITPNYPSSKDTFPRQAVMLEPARRMSTATEGGPQSAILDLLGQVLELVQDQILDLKAHYGASAPRPAVVNDFLGRLVTLVSDIPADGDLNDLEARLYVDPSTGVLKLKRKDAGHTETVTVT
jgi:hypothetical protein